MLITQKEQPNSMSGCRQWKNQACLKINQEEFHPYHHPSMLHRPTRNRRSDWVASEFSDVYILMNNLGWYINLYYKFREYPISELNSSFKPNELRSLYSSMLKKLFLLFQLDTRREGEIEGLISKNNYELMINKRAETNLAQQDLPHKTPPEFTPESGVSLDSMENDEKKECLLSESASRWLVQTDPTEKNMDVFYQLMIKMIRVSLRRLMVETFAIDKYGKSLSKDAVNQIFKNRSQFQTLREKINRPEGNPPGSALPSIEITCFPATIEELKFEFLRYCISCKIYNDPKTQSLYKDAQSQSESMNTSHNEGQSVRSSNVHSSSNESENTKQAEQTQQKVESPPKIMDNQIEDLILKVSNSETNIFNIIMERYINQLRKNGNNQVQIVGVKHIAQSLFEMALGQPHLGNSAPSAGLNRNHFRRDLFEDQGKFEKSNDLLSNHNILLATWFDLILFKESPLTLFEIIEQLVKLQQKQPYIEEDRSIPQLPSSPFYFKISSYHHLLILNSTKNILTQSLCKVNYLLVLLRDIMGQSGLTQKRSFKNVALRPFTANGQIWHGVQITVQRKSQRQIWKEQSLQLLLAKWKIIANVLTEVCVKNSRAFFAAIFEKCVHLLDQQLSLQVELIQQLMTIAESISDPNSQSNHSQEGKGREQSTVRSLYAIVREIIGVGELGEEAEGQEEKGLSSSNTNRTTRGRQSSFANRQQSTQQLSKWAELISQNIYVYEQYGASLKLISKLFKDNHLFVAIWFNKLHFETRSLLRKVQRDKLKTIFNKFNNQLPLLWESMTCDREPVRGRNRGKRGERGQFRTRISSIKLEKSLKMVEKKAIVLNYMIKAEVELYSHYMLINYLNGQKNLTQFFEKEMGIRKQASARPALLDHTLVRSLLLFTNEDPQPIASIPIRRAHKNFTSAFAMDRHSPKEPIRTMNTIEKSQANAEIEELVRAIGQFQRPMNIELDLQEHWQLRFGEQQVQFLGQLSDHLRYINEINYLHQFWSWAEPIPDDKPRDELRSDRRMRLQLLNGSEYKQDLDQIQAAFKELERNQTLLSEVVLSGQAGVLLREQKLGEMLKRIRSHNKQLYMIIEAISEGENYYKLIASNLIGRDRNSQFRNILEQTITLYKTTPREKPPLRLLDGLKNSRHQSMAAGRRMSPSISHFQFAPEYYRTQTKILRVNCLVASFEVGNSIYRNIKHHHLLSRQRLDRLAIIGSSYYDRLEGLLSEGDGKGDGLFSVSEDALLKVKSNYEKKLLLLLITLITLNYQHQQGVRRYAPRGSKFSERGQFSSIPEEDLLGYPGVLRRYAQLLRRFIFWRIQQNIKRVEERQNFEKNEESDQKQPRQFSLTQFLSEVLQLNQKRDQFGQQQLLSRLEKAVEKQGNLKFSEQFKKTWKKQSVSVMNYNSEQERVQYLKKRLAYLLMRQMYFTLNYDNDFLQQKSANSKRNYTIYQQRILRFYEQIIELDYQQYTERKEEELKKRSVHLRNYQFKYEQPPPLTSIEKEVNQLICCLFNQLLTTYTTSVEHRMFTTKHKPNQSASTSQQPLYQQYCATQYIKEVSADQYKSVKQRKQRRKEHKASIASIFANIFKPDEQPTIVTQDMPQSTKSWMTVLVYTPQKFQTSQAIQIYLKIISNFQYRASGVKDVNGKGSCGLRNIPLTEMQLQIIRQNERSLITMLKSDLLQRINEAKCLLIRRNLISNIQKLYINLDVRHKVFESFKDRILNYEMQKAKIYHQYMDYIRGLKLDVYSHMAGEQSLPYIKIIHAVKLYRLNIKKMELQKRVSQQFEKNLQKWNEGIQKNLIAYDDWLEQEEAAWSQQQTLYEIDKKNLFQIYHAVSKQMARQKKLLKNKCSASMKTLSKPTLMSEASEHEHIRLQQSRKTQSLMKKSSVNYRKKPQFSQIDKFQTAMPSLKSSMLPSATYSSSAQLSRINKSSSGMRGLSIKYEASHLPAKENGWVLKHKQDQEQKSKMDKKNKLKKGREAVGARWILHKQSL